MNVTFTTTIGWEVREERVTVEANVFLDGVAGSVSSPPGWYADLVSVKLARADSIDLASLLDAGAIGALESQAVDAWRSQVPPNRRLVEILPEDAP
jgi:hypothetical protein